MKRIIFLVSMIVAIGFSQCKKEAEMLAFKITPPFAALNPEFTVFEYESGVADTFVYRTGSQLFVPPFLWVDSSGMEVKGKVAVKYREFHRAEEIFFSGAHLNYDSLGEKNVLTTAGMFEIRAFQNGKELAMKNGKEMGVRMASYNATPNYNFYNMSDSSGNWQYKGQATAEINTGIRTIKEQIDILQAKDKFPYDAKTTFVLNYDAALDIFFKNDYKAISKNYENKTVLRKIESYGAALSKIYGGRWNEIRYKGLKFYAWEMVWEIIGSQKMPTWAMKEGADITDLKFQGGTSYKMELISYKRNQRATLFVNAKIPLKVLFALSPNARQEEYDQVLEQIRIEQERLAMQAEVYRSFSVTAPGFHNWDVVYKNPNTFMAKAQISFDKALSKEEVPELYYFINGNKSFVKINNWDTDSIYVSIDSTAKYIAVLSPTKAAIFENKDYKNLDFDKIRKTGSLNLPFKVVDIQSANDALKLLN